MDVVRMETTTTVVQDHESGMTTTTETRRRVVDPEDTVPAKVSYNDRVFTDKIGAVIYVLSYIAFIATGSYLAANSHGRYIVEEDGTRTINPYYEEDARSCCEKNDNLGYICNEFDDNRNRWLKAGNSKFDGDEGMFDAFLEAPEIIVGLLSITLAVSLIWVVLLRFFSKTIVILTEAIKVAIFIAMGILQESTGTRVICFLIAFGLIVYDWWVRKQLMFAAKMLKHSTKALKANPTMFIGCILMKGFYALNAFLFVYFFSQSFDVAEIRSTELCKIDDDFFGNSFCQDQYCEFAYPSYVRSINIYMSLSYLWTVLLFDKMRLSIIATMVGSWHFHPEDKPGLFVSIKNTLSTSFGTLSVASLISTIAERINRMAAEGCWKSWLSPTVCVTGPLSIILCVFGACLNTLIRMLTKFAVILHVFTGLPFVGSGKKVFKILSRHFKNGFVTEVTSKSVLELGSYIFSICIALIAWAWIDDKFDSDTIPGQSDAIYAILFTIFGLFNLWFPVLGLYILIIVNSALQRWERNKMRSSDCFSNDDDGLSSIFCDNTNHIWVAPFAAIFVGCISMMFFTFLAAIFLDTIDTLFLCFSIDKDNHVDMSNDEFDKLIKEMPTFVEAVIVDSSVTTNTINSAPVATVVHAIPASDPSASAPAASAPPLAKY